MRRVDVHQHIWTDPLLDELGARRTPPMARHDNGLTVLHSAGEQPYVIDVATERGISARRWFDETAWTWP